MARDKLLHLAVGFAVASLIYWLHGAFWTMVLALGCLQLGRESDTLLSCLRLRSGLNRDALLASIADTIATLIGGFAAFIVWTLL